MQTEQLKLINNAYKKSKKALHGILAPPIGYISLWTLKSQILLFK